MHRGNPVKRWSVLRQETSVPSPVKHLLGALHKVSHVIPTETLSKCLHFTDDNKNSSICGAKCFLKILTEFSQHS